MNKLDFLQGFFRSPLEVGSIVPSSKYMVRQVLKRVVMQKPKYLVEFGAGSGVFTKELYRYAQENKVHFITFEKDDTLRVKLKKELPDLNIYADALMLPQVLAEKGWPNVDFILCGLPFSLFPRSKTDQIFSMIHEQLAPAALFMMYQYSTHLRSKLRNMFSTVNTQFVLLNLPPTFLYACLKSSPQCSSEQKAQR